MKSISVFILSTILLGCGCNQKIKFPQKIDENKDSKTYLTGMVVDNSHKEPDDASNSFYLRYSEKTRLKRSFSSSQSALIAHITPIDGKFHVRSLLLSNTLYEFGRNIGHGEPLAEWSPEVVVDSTQMAIIKFYLKNKAKITVYSKGKVDVTRWNPILELPNKNNFSQYVIRIEKKILDETKFDLDCDILEISDVLTDGKTERYNIHTYNFLYQYAEGYYVAKIKRHSMVSYTFEGKEIGRNSGENSESSFMDVSRIDFIEEILNYYLAHKNEIPEQ